MVGLFSFGGFRATHIRGPFTGHAVILFRAFRVRGAGVLMLAGLLVVLNGLRVVELEAG